MLSRKIYLDYENDNDNLYLEIKQDLKYGYAGEVWDGSLVLAYYLIQNKFKFKDKNVLELGAGTGILSLVSSYLGAKHVVITDLQDVLSLISENVELNSNSKVIDKNKITIKKIDWNIPEDSIDLKKEYISDFIILSECIWNSEHIEPLCKTLKNLISDNTVLIISCTFRDGDHKNQLNYIKYISSELGLRLELIDQKDHNDKFSSPDIFLMKMLK